MNTANELKGLKEALIEAKTLLIHYRCDATIECTLDEECDHDWSGWNTILPCAHRGNKFKNWLKRYDSLLGKDDGK